MGGTTAQWKTIVCFLFLSLTLIGSAETVHAAVSDAYPGGQVILSWTGDPAHTQTVSWKTTGGDPGYLKWAKRGEPFLDEDRVKTVVTEIRPGGRSVRPGSGGSGGATAEDQTDPAKSERETARAQGESYYRYEAVIHGLEQDTEYEYSIGNGLQWSRRRPFRTAPDHSLPRVRRNGRETPTAFFYFGDAQFAEDRKKADAWQQMLETAAERHPQAAFGLMGGDLINRGERLEEWQLFLEKAEPVFSKIPLMTAVGNHEARKAKEQYSRMLALPQWSTGGTTLPGVDAEVQQETFYSFDYGSCHILSLDSSVFLKPGAVNKHRLEQIRSWIREDLAGTAAPWKIVMLHHPPYGFTAGGKIYERIRQEWCSLFAASGVDLVFSGHQHLYLRTEEIGGVTYIMGNAGQRRSRAFRRDHVPKYVRRLNVDSSNYQVIEANETDLTMTAYNAEGRVIDQWTKKETDAFPRGKSAGLLVILFIFALIFVRIFLWPPGTVPKRPY